MDFIDKIIDGGCFTEENLTELLSVTDAEKQKHLFNRAYNIKAECVGRSVYLRGIVELSNICRKNCFYCGIRRDNANVKRYEMSEDEVLEAAGKAWKWGYGSIVLQAGENISDSYVDYIARLLRSIKRISNGELGITLSLGEQTKDVYKLWFREGAHRYLLRIETSDREFYTLLHPKDHSFDCRRECLVHLKEAGYMLGTGVMIGLPGQTVEQLARDILFFAEIDADMYGMGPYIPHPDTPLAEQAGNFEERRIEQLNLSLRMIAAARIVLRDVNIASTTALQTIDEYGREKGLLAGANVIMPNITDIKYKKNYMLYDNKPCIDENADGNRDVFEAGIKLIGETIEYGKWGDSLHYKRRIKNVSSG